MWRLRESHPGLFTVETLAVTRGAMNIRYVAEVKEDAMGLVRTLPDAMGEVDFRRKDLAPLKTEDPMWVFLQVC